MGNSGKHKKSRQPNRRRSGNQFESEFDFNPQVEDFLRQVGCRPRQVADDFWKELHKRYGEDAARFLELVDNRRLSDDATQSHVDVIQEQYALKNKSLDFSVAISSQYSGRFFATFLTDVCSLYFETAPTTILDIGCDNGILTAFYATQFPNAKVLGIDRCHEAIVCAEELKQRLGLTNLSFAQSDAFQSSLPSILTLNGWDLIFMTLCGYEELIRQHDAEQTMAARFHSLLSSRGTGIVVEPIGSPVLESLIEQGGTHFQKILGFEDFGGGPADVEMAVVNAKV